jgi:hypothetical protein
MRRFGKHASIKRVRLAAASLDLPEARGIVVGVLLGVIAWAAIIAASVAVMALL